MAQQSRALLQARSGPSTATLEVNTEARFNTSLAVNPSGAAAPLDQTGYAAVADRCCQEEMKQFIHRQVLNMGYEVCDSAGLLGIVPYHSCGKGGVQTFSALTANLLKDSADRCTWLAKTGTCTPRPADCPDFVGVLSPSCGCSRSAAAHLDFTLGSIHSNLGGLGPDGGAKELRYAGVGTSSTGQKFDLVVTNLSPYQTPAPQANGVKNGFGRISHGLGSSTDFLFSFMVPGTNTAVTLPEVHMTVFDVDGDPNGGLESTSSKGYTGYVTDATISMVASNLPDGRTQFTSDGVTQNIPNPTDPNALLPEQRAASVMYFYKNVESFELSFGLAGSGNWPRNLNFFFDSPLNDQCGP